jgi:hypothetical protein
MQVKWEYLFILDQHLGKYSNHFLPYSINDRETRDWKKGKSIFVTMSELGENSWEPISSNPITEGDPVELNRWAFIFKRPKQ